MVQPNTILGESESQQTTRITERKIAWDVHSKLILAVGCKSELQIINYTF